jgi:hypothetical protein
MWEDPANAKGRGSKTEKILNWPSQFRHGINNWGPSRHEDEMRDKSSSAVRKVEAEAVRLAKRRHRHELRGRQLAEAEENHQETVAAVILDSIRAAGLTKLPLSAILEKIAMLGQAVGTAQDNSAPMTNSDTEQPVLESGGSQQTEDVDR